MNALDIAIDVSDAQGIIDWPAVRAAGIRVAFVKASEGATFVAKSFERNRHGAAAAGIVVVPYHFLRPHAPDQQIMHFREIADLEEGMPAMLDWEGRAAQTCAPAQAEDAGRRVMAITNRQPIFYYGRPGASPAAPTAWMRGCPRAVPRYPVTGVNSFAALPSGCRNTPLRYWANEHGDFPQFAQYTCWGRIAGIKSVVDRSVMFFPTIEDALAWLTGQVPEKSAVVAQDAPQPISAPGVAAERLVPRHAPAPGAAGDDPGDHSAADLNAEELDRLSGDSGQ